jgi:hypothetical protein
VGLGRLVPRPRPGFDRRGYCGQRRTWLRRLLSK